MSQKTKEKIDRILTQAKESVKVLETLQREALARARNVVNIPAKDEAKRITNEKIVASLKKMGLATRAEVRELEKKVEDLASELRSQLSKINKSSKKNQNRTESTDA